MYLILNSEYKVMDICEVAKYVRRQSNGIVVSCPQDDAEAIYSDDSNTFYPIERTGFVADSHTLVQVDSVPEGIVAGYYYYRDGQYYTSQTDLDNLAKSQRADVGRIAFVAMAQDGKIDDVTITEHANQFPNWQPDVSYSQNNIEKLYCCNESHTSDNNVWEPGVYDWDEVK